MVGQTLGHYTILEKIGSGGMGEVYLAADQTLNRRVALKVLPSALAGGERSARFAREARQVTTGNVSKYFPQWSPDGRWIYYASIVAGNARQIFRVPVSGGSPEPVTNGVYYYRWSPDGTRMYFSGNFRGSNDIWEMRLADARERRLTRFTQRDGSIFSEALAASRTHLYFTWRHDVGDIWTMDVVDEAGR